MDIVRALFAVADLTEMVPNNEGASGQRNPPNARNNAPAGNQQRNDPNAARRGNNAPPANNQPPRGNANGRQDGNRARR